MTVLGHAVHMNRTVIVFLALTLVAWPACKKDGSVDSGTAEPQVVDAEEAGLDPKWPTIRLNGELMSVRWSDGDSFKFKSGPYEGRGVRLMGYNTLESYGPVHRWGEWTAVELYRIAKSSWRLGASATWDCTTDGSADGYGRVLVSCPAAAEHIISEGHATVFAIDEEPSKELLAAQRRAMKKRVGIWAKGTPLEIITSLHSADEDGDKTVTYNRVVDTRTGEARQAEHKSTYETCQEVCLSGKEGSCMVYVPFSNRYKNKAECLVVREKGK